jgi:Trypsin-co-occurring domain 1
MNSAESAINVVTAKLPSGLPIKVEVIGSDSDDGMTSVGIRHLDLSAALDTVAEIGSVVVEKLKAISPAKTTVELRLGFAVEAGKLTALWVGGKSEASLTVTLEWSQSSTATGGEDG